MKKVLILGAGGQIARHVINQLADKQTIKQTLFARQPAKIHKPGNDSNLLIVFYVQIMPDDFVMQLHR
ncbi:hypothetical protein PO455_24700, partial [Escherichia coli]